MSESGADPEFSWWRWAIRVATLGGGAPEEPPTEMKNII